MKRHFGKPGKGPFYFYAFKGWSLDWYFRDAYVALGWPRRALIAIGVTEHHDAQELYVRWDFGLRSAEVRTTKDKMTGRTVDPWYRPSRDAA